nr:hypothetical protein [uncultured Campylobacter sp.]
MGTIPAGSGDDIPSGGFSDDLAFSAISLNGDCGSYFDGSAVICTIDKTEYKVSFSFMAQISKSDFGIFYGVVPVDGATDGISRLTHSGAANRPPVYILPAVYVMLKPSKPASNEGGGSDSGGGSGQSGENSEGGGSGENGDNPKPIG